MARTKQSVKKTLLCATRFWSVTDVSQWSAPGKNTTPTLRAGVRHVVRKQGFTPAEIDKAERQLVSEGLLVRGGKGTGASLALTPKATKVSCATTKLAPWTNSPYAGAALAGADAHAYRAVRQQGDRAIDALTRARDWQSWTDGAMSPTDILIKHGHKITPQEHKVKTATKPCKLRSRCKRR